MISHPDRERAVRLIDEAIAAGARKRQACETLGITLRTYQRWTAEGDGIKADGRPTAKRQAPRHKLNEEERAKVLEVAIAPNSAVYRPARSYRRWRTRASTSPRNRVSIGSCERPISNTLVVAVMPQSERRQRHTVPTVRTSSGAGTSRGYRARQGVAGFICI